MQALVVNRIERVYNLPVWNCKIEEICYTVIDYETFIEKIYSVILTK